MKYFFEAIHDIEFEISAEDTTAQDLKKHLNIQQFLKTHCQSHQYTFQVNIAALTFEQKDQINIYIDQIRYSCEKRLFLQDHSLGGLLFTKQALTCNSPIEVEYYLRRLQKDQLCYYCELEEFLIDIDDDILENYQSVYPLCSNCKIGGRKIHTWGKKKIHGISSKRQKLN
ncbi:unnamed protein product [Rhizophagus irregularis]|nr:unnamed protein product [Rhizophagus irregularis]